MTVLALVIIVCAAAAYEMVKINNRINAAH